MKTHDKEIVSELTARLAELVGSDRFDTWLSGLRLVPGERSLLIEAPNQFLRDWVRDHFRNDIQSAVERVLGAEAVIEFRINPELDEAPAASHAAQSHRQQEAQRQPSGIGLKRADSQRVRKPRGRSLRRFEDLVLGPGNKMAAASAQWTIQHPGEVSPLVFCGTSGVGKTHLLESICHAARQQGYGSVVYLSAEEFTTQFLEGLYGKGLPAFRYKIRNADFLLIDDVHFFAGKTATLAEVVHTLDTLQRKDRQIVVACDRSPAELPALGNDLMTRLSGGLICPIDLPDYETRLGIVQRLAQQLQLDLPLPVQQQVARDVLGSAWQLRGALNRIRMTSVAENCAVSADLAHTALHRLAAGNHRMIHLSDVGTAVCEVFGLDPHSLASARRTKSLTHPRMLAMYLARKHTRAALSEIGQYFGGRRHSTVVSAYKKVSHWVAHRAEVELAHQAFSVEEALRRVEQRMKAG